MRHALTTALALALAAPLAAAPAPDATPTRPVGPAPRLMSVTRADENELLSEVSVTQFVPVTRTRTVNVNGVNQTLPSTTYEATQMKTQAKVSLEGATITTAGGDKVSAKEAAKRLASGGVVAVSAVPGQPVDPVWLKSLREDVIVINPAAPKDAPPGVPVPLPIPAVPPAPAVPPVAPPAVPK